MKRWDILKRTAAWIAVSTIALVPSGFLVRADAATLVGLRSIGWGDTLVGSSGDLFFDCENPTVYTLVTSFQAPAGIGAVWGVEAAIDFCTAPFTLPEWWQVTQVGGCREDGLVVSADFSPGPFTHQDFFGGLGVPSMTFITNHMGVDFRARIDVTVTMDPVDAVSLTSGEEYYAFRIDFALPTGSCNGCDFPACFAFNELRLLHTGGVADIWGDGYSSFARWQGGQGDCPFIVSVEPGSWGSVKALYR